MSRYLPARSISSIAAWARLHDVDIIQWWEEIDESGAKPMFQ